MKLLHVSKYLLGALFLVTVLAPTAGCMKYSDPGTQAGPPQGPGDLPEFDPNAIGTNTVVTFRQSIVRMQSMLDNQVMPSGNSVAQTGINRALTNLPATTNPGKTTNASLSATITAAWGFAAQLANSDTVLSSNYGITASSATMAGQMPQLVDMAAKIFSRGIGTPESAPPSAIPDLFPKFRAIVSSSLQQMLSANPGMTFRQGIAAAAFIAMMGALQSGY